MESAGLAKLKVRLSKHIEDKLDKELSRLGITKKVLENTIAKPDEVLFDTESTRSVAVGRKHNLFVIYERRGEDMLIITAIYSSNLERVIQRRKRSGRWL